jgi:hypothetical protein
MNKIKFNYPISNYDIINFCNKYKINLSDVVVLQQINNKLEYGSYVVNLDSKNGGSHWVALIYEPLYSIYFDSYGVIPPPEIINNIRSKTLYHSNFIIQDENSVLCGWYCIAFLYFIQNSKIKSIKNRFHQYTKMFYNNEEINDSVVISYIKDIVHNEY